MNKFKLIIASLGVIMGIVGFATNVSAQSSTPECTIDPIPMNQWQKSFTTAGNNISSKFTLKGDANCTKTMTLAVWNSPSADGQPINEQRLYSSTTATFTKGTHSITAKLPGTDCYFQADLLKGSNATAPDGTANYAYQNGQILTNHPLVDFKFGGKKVCEEKPEKPTQPETPETPQTPVTPVAKVEELPSTGAGSVLASVFGLSTTTGLAYNYIRSRKQLR